MTTDIISYTNSSVLIDSITDSIPTEYSNIRLDYGVEEGGVNVPKTLIRLTDTKAISVWGERRISPEALRIRSRVVLNVETSLSFGSIQEIEEFTFSNNLNWSGWLCDGVAIDSNKAVVIYMNYASDETVNGIYAVVLTTNTFNQISVGTPVKISPSGYFSNDIPRSACIIKVAESELATTLSIFHDSGPTTVNTLTRGVYITPVILVGSTLLPNPRVKVNQDIVDLNRGVADGRAFTLSCCNLENNEYLILYLVRPGDGVTYLYGKVLTINNDGIVSAIGSSILFYFKSTSSPIRRSRVVKLEDGKVAICFGDNTAGNISTVTVFISQITDSGSTVNSGNFYIFSEAAVELENNYGENIQVQNQNTIIVSYAKRIDSFESTIYTQIGKVSGLELDVGEPIALTGWVGNTSYTIVTFLDDNRFIGVADDIATTNSRNGIVVFSGVISGRDIYSIAITTDAYDGDYTYVTYLKSLSLYLDVYYTELMQKIRTVNFGFGDREFVERNIRTIAPYSFFDGTLYLYGRFSMPTSLGTVAQIIRSYDLGQTFDIVERNWGSDRCAGFAIYDDLMIAFRNTTNEVECYTGTDVLEFKSKLPVERVTDFRNVKLNYFTGDIYVAVKTADTVMVVKSQPPYTTWVNYTGVHGTDRGVKALDILY